MLRCVPTIARWGNNDLHGRDDPPGHLYIVAATMKHVAATMRDVIALLRTMRLQRQRVAWLCFHRRDDPAGRLYIVVTVNHIATAMRDHAGIAFTDNLDAHQANEQAIRPRF